MQVKLYLKHSALALLFFATSLFSFSLQAQCSSVNGGELVSADNGTRYIPVCLDSMDEVLTDIIRTDFDGANSQYFLTNAAGFIIRRLNGSPPFDLRDLGPGVFAIWSAAFSGGLTGAAVGENICATGATGCFSLSNALIVNRKRGEDCFEFCPVLPGNLTLANSDSTSAFVCRIDGVGNNIAVDLNGELAGDNMTFVITNDQGEILGIPAGNGPFDLDAAGPGTCLIFHISYQDGLEGLAPGNTFDDFDGCFSISNPITVDRENVDGGRLFIEGNMEVNDTTICAGDGVSDAFNTMLSGAQGESMAYLITDTDNEILMIADNPPFDLDAAGVGTCRIYHISWNRELIGLGVGTRISELAGCFDVSGAITVTRQSAEGGNLKIADADGGGDALEICAGDGVSDAFNVELTDAVGATRLFVITDADRNILGMPASGPFDLDGAGPGACLIYALNYSGDITGLAMGENLDNLEGCFGLSNPITVTRNAVAGGTLALIDGGDALEICAGDGESDAFNVSLIDTLGDDFTYVITDGDGMILGTPADQPFDLEGAGGGACLIYALSSNGDLDGLAEGQDLGDLSGCFALSNPITVTRLTGDDCPGACLAEGGTLMLAGDDGGDALSICAGDGVSDTFNVVLMDNVGDTSLWVITDSDLNVLGVPAAPPFDLEGAGPGVCLLWNLSAQDSIRGVEEGVNVADLEGCLDFSNPITVTRTAVNGGTLALVDQMSTDSITICAGDGMDDFFNVTLADTVGTNFTYVITDTAGLILGIPADQPFNLEGAGEGICLVWALSYEDGLVGLEVDSNATNFEGCFALSNPITVTRQTGDDCTNGLVGGVDINEIARDGSVELTNTGTTAIDFADFYLGHEGDWHSVSELAVSCGSTLLKPGELFSVQLPNAFGEHGELTLSLAPNPGDHQLLAYLPWGTDAAAHPGMTAALRTGLWAAANVPAGPEAEVSLQLVPETTVREYALATPSLCSPNSLSTRVSAPEAAEVLKLFPNPFANSLTLEVAGLRGQRTEVALMDLNGRLVETRFLRRLNGRTSLNLNSLPAGTYLLRLTNEGGTSTRRVVKR